MSKIRAVLYGLLLILSLSGIAATAASAGAATGPAHYTKGLATYSGCVSGSFVYVNAHWSSSWNNQAWLGFSDGNGNKVYLDVPYPNGNCLIQSSF